MKSNIDSIFKSYDIRGIYPDQLNSDVAFKIGSLFAKKTRAKNIAVGRDGRFSSPLLSKYLEYGISSYGSKFLDLKRIPTEIIYFVVGFYKNIDAGIMVTASHNPPQYNGFKLIKKGIKIIRGKSLKKDFKKEKVRKIKKIKKLKKINFWKDYIKYLFSHSKIRKIKEFKVVIDTSNGTSAVALKKILPKLKIKPILLNFDIKGYPNHSPNPLLKESRKQISEVIKKEKADFGFIFDGDGDRIILISEKGKIVPPDITLLFLAKHFLKKYPKSPIVYNIICSKSVPYFIKKWQGKPIVSKVGFVNIRETLLKYKGVLGGELSGHYSFSDYFYCDSGIFAFLNLLEFLSTENKKVSILQKELTLFKKSPEINFKVQNDESKQKIINLLKKKYSNKKQNLLDGVSIDFKNWWFNLRPSNTEPLLRLTIEAESEKLLKQKKKELTNLIKRNL